MIYEHYTDEDKRFLSKLETIDLLEDGVEPLKFTKREDIKTYPVFLPDDQYSFIHESTLIEYHGTLFAAWFNCPDVELKGHTPIRERRSKDKGKTWSDINVVAEDKSGKILYCPPIFGICDDKLYMFVNEMVGPDLIHSLDLYIFNEETDKFEFLWSRPIPFKINTNVITLSNGKLMIPGRIAKLDSFPNTPAVLISDSGKIDAEWRLVKIQEDGKLPDGVEHGHPEISCILHGERILMFSRNCRRNIPLLYISNDNGETWSAPMAHDIPFSASKIFAGNLSDGRSFCIGNIYPGRDRLAILFAKTGEEKFSSGYMINAGINKELGYGSRWHYPCAYEAFGKLYVIYTVDIKDETDIGYIKCHRGAVISELPL